VLDTMTEWIIDVIDALGYVGVGFLVALESVVPVVPSEVVQPLAGFTASQGDANLVVMIVVATFASVVGSCVLYWLAGAYGEERLRRLVVRYRFLHVSVDDLDRADRWFDRRGGLAVLIGRCVPVIRALISVPAGLRRMPIIRFAVLTAIGSLVWNTGLIVAGYHLGENWEEVKTWMEPFQYLVIAVMVVAVGWFVWRRVIGPRHDESPAEDHDTAATESELAG
jgi:membrane protein DedA with SNARE-associated domain